SSGGLGSPARGSASAAASRCRRSPTSSTGRLARRSRPSRRRRRRLPAGPGCAPATPCGASWSRTRGRAAGGRERPPPWPGGRRRRSREERSRKTILPVGCSWPGRPGGCAGAGVGGGLSVGRRPPQVVPGGALVRHAARDGDVAGGDRLLERRADRRPNRQRSLMVARDGGPDPGNTDEQVIALDRGLAPAWRAARHATGRGRGGLPGEIPLDDEPVTGVTDVSSHVVDAVEVPDEPPAPGAQDVEVEVAVRGSDRVVGPAHPSDPRRGENVVALTELEGTADAASLPVVVDHGG